MYSKHKGITMSKEQYNILPKHIEDNPTDIRTEEEAFAFYYETAEAMLELALDDVRHHTETFRFNDKYLQKQVMKNRHSALMWIFNKDRAAHVYYSFNYVCSILERDVKRVRKVFIDRMTEEEIIKYGMYAGSEGLK